jgi:DNA polymerase III delta subunit
VKFISVPEKSIDSFALTNALMDGNRAAALEALDVLKFRQTKPEFVMAEISGLFVQLYMTKLFKDNGLSQSEITKAFGASKAYRVADFKVGLFLKAIERLSFEQLKRSLDLCRDADLAMKTYGKRNFEQIEKLVCLL